MRGALLYISDVKILNDQAFEGSVAALTLGYVLSNDRLLRTFTIIKQDPIRVSITNDAVEEYTFIKLNVPSDLLNMLTSQDRETVVMAGDIFSIDYERYIPKNYQKAITRTDLAQGNI